MHRNNLNKVAEDSNSTTPHNCASCANLVWLVGIGLGARCKHSSNKNASWIKEGDSDNLIQTIGPAIPGRSFFCEFYSPKDLSINDKENNVY